MTYEVAAGRWWLDWPCEACGGVRLPLRRGDSFGNAGRGRVQVERACLDRRCPGCESRARRLEASGEGPAVWYDTLLGDWVLRLPIDSYGDTALLPLEIGWFDSPLARVYRTAADVVYGAEELDGVGGDQRTDRGF